MTFRALVLCLATACALFATDASAMVRFGRGVRIGGHDVSGQTYNRHRRGLFILYRHRPPGEGCRWHAAGSVFEGRRLAARTRICRLQTIPPARR